MLIMGAREEVVPYHLEGKHLLGLAAQIILSFHLTRCSPSFFVVVVSFCFVF